MHANMLAPAPAAAAGITHQVQPANGYKVVQDRGSVRGHIL
jgi:hypothetical protein